VIRGQARRVLQSNPREWQNMAILIRPEDRWLAVSDMPATGPAFRFEEFFARPVKGWGIFQDRFGTVRKRFESNMHGRWADDTFVLDEHFVYADGDTDDRTWRVTMPSDGLYRAEAHDIVGSADGRVKGDGVNFRYALRVPVGGRTIVFDFDDWMVPHADGLLNVSRATKFGIRVGQLTAFFWPVRVSDLPAGDAANQGEVERVR